MRTFWRDIRYGLRVLRGNPGFTAVAVLTMAIGIASTTTAFTWIDSILLRPIPGARAAHELVVIETLTPNGEYIKTSYPDYRDYRDSARLTAGIATTFNTSLHMGDGEGGRLVWAELVTGNYFTVLGVRPLTGRFFSTAESADPPSTQPVAVISQRLWLIEFNGDPGVIGRTVRFNRRPLTIIGIAPPGFQGTMAGLAYDVWVPITMIDQLNRSTATFLTNRSTRALDLVARLRPGVTVEQARAEIASRARALAAAYPRSNEGIGANLESVGEAHLLGAQAVLRRPLRILIAICAVVLLIVCANVANLLLARATARQKEFGIRLAMGAGRIRLARQLLTECLVVSSVAALAGALATPWLQGSLWWLLPPMNIPLRFDTEFNPRVLLCTMLVCVLAAVLSSLAPLLCSLRPDLNSILKEGGRGEKVGARAHRLSGFLVVSEVALAAVALVGAGLFVKSFQAVRAIEPGFDTANLTMARFSLADTGYPLAQQHEFCRRLRERLESAPGITAVTYADVAPLGFDTGPWQDLEIQGRTPAQGENMKLYRSSIAPGYFAALGIPRLEGRDFTALDDEKAPPVMIVNDAFTRRYWDGANPLGRKVRAFGRWFTVVGLVKTVKYHNLAGAPEPYFYVPYRQGFTTGLHTIFFLRTAGDRASALAGLRREAAALDRNAEIMEAMPLADYTMAALYPLKVAASMLGVLGGLAVLLAAVGLYSVMAYAVSQRTQEVGIRMALGARPADVLSMVVMEGLRLTAAGLIAGLLVAFAVTRLVSGMLVNVSPADPPTFVGAALFLALIALLASYLPARRATQVDPMMALRGD